MITPRSLRRTQEAFHVRISLFGDTGTGKSEFLRSIMHAGASPSKSTSPDISGAAQIPNGPTSGIVIAESSVDVSSNPRQPTSGTCSPVTLTWREFGEGSPNRTFSKLQDRHTSGADAVGIFFSAKSDASLQSVFETWRFQIAKACANSTLEPFIFVVETHCDTLSATRIERDRRILDIGLRRLYGAQYMFFQVDATHRQACFRIVHQVAIQARHQLRRETLRIRIVSRTTAAHWLDALEDTRIGTALSDCMDSDRVYECQVTCMRAWQSVRTWLVQRFPWIFPSVAAHLHEDSFTLI